MMMMILVILNMSSAAEECRQPSGNFILSGEWSPCFGPLHLEQVMPQSLVVYTSVYHERLSYNLLISCPSCYGQHGHANSTINWSRFSGVGYGTLFHSRHCVERQETKVGHGIMNVSGGTFTAFQFSFESLYSKVTMCFVIFVYFCLLIGSPWWRY